MKEWQQVKTQFTQLNLVVHECVLICDDHHNGWMLVDIALLRC